jgi:hypothetical protein
MNRGARKEYLDGTRRHGSPRFPLANFFHSRVGRNWDEVHSELSKEFDRRTYAGYLFWRRMRQYEVVLNCWKGAETGKIYDSEDRPVNGFYVHPFSNILCYQKVNSRLPETAKPTTRLIIDAKRAYEKLHGIWFYTEYIKNEDTYVSYYFGEREYYKPYEVIHKRSLNKKQLKQLGLKNNSHDEIVEILRENKKREDELRARDKARQKAREAEWQQQIP